MANYPVASGGCEHCRRCNGGWLESGNTMHINAVNKRELLTREKICRAGSRGDRTGWLEPLSLFSILLSIDSTVGPKGNRDPGPRTQGFKTQEEVLSARQLKIVGHFRENYVLSRLDVR
jgi:hypothetical protein